MNQKDEVFLIDSNSLISPYQLYYPFDFASRFWDQLKEKIEDGNVIILDVIKDELMKGNDELSKWINQFNHNLILDRRTSEILENYGKVLNYIQASGLYKEKALTEWSNVNVADPWLIAVALTFGHTIITFEKHNGGIKAMSQLGSAKIPDVCRAFDIECRDLFYMMRALSFQM